MSDVNLIMIYILSLMIGWVGGLLLFNFMQDRKYKKGRK